MRTYIFLILMIGGVLAYADEDCTQSRDLYERCIGV